ncbi:MAG: IS66 family transposase [Gemmataceae bacterium]
MSTTRNAEIIRAFRAGRMTDLAVATGTHPDAQRLAKRFRKDGADLLTFAEFPETPANTNRAEQEIRSAVRMRKVSYGSQSDRGMRSLKIRGLDPLAETRKARITLLKTGQLPTLPGLGG